MHIVVSPLELKTLRRNNKIRITMVSSTIDFKVSETITLVNQMDQDDSEPVKIIDVDANVSRVILTVEK